MSTLERAIEISAMAHAGQVDNAGQPYILHVLRVVLAMQTNNERIVAALHDVLEDTAVTVDALRRAGFSQTQLDALSSVTQRPGEIYTDFVLRGAANPIGRVVKRADLQDNLNLARLPFVTMADEQRATEYRAAIQALATDRGA